MMRMSNKYCRRIHLGHLVYFITQEAFQPLIMKASLGCSAFCALQQLSVVPLPPCFIPNTAFHSGSCSPFTVPVWIIDLVLEPETGGSSRCSPLTWVNKNFHTREPEDPLGNVAAVCVLRSQLLLLTGQSTNFQFHSLMSALIQVHAAAATLGPLWLRCSWYNVSKYSCFSFMDVWTSERWTTSPLSDLDHRGSSTPLVCTYMLQTLYSLQKQTDDIHFLGD